MFIPIGVDSPMDRPQAHRIFYDRDEHDTSANGEYHYMILHESPNGYIGYMTVACSKMQLQRNIFRHDMDSKWSFSECQISYFRTKWNVQSSIWILAEDRGETVKALELSATNFLDDDHIDNIVTWVQSFLGIGINSYKFINIY